VDSDSSLELTGWCGGGVGLWFGLQKVFVRKGQSPA
jgi:hypothetical protein